MIRPAAHEAAAIRRGRARVAAIKAEVASQVDVPPADMTDEQQRLCLAYCETARRAQTSRTFADCHAAGQAWKAFIGAYAPVPEAEPGVLPKPLPGYER